mmetsp:Transcript_86172/g.239853  ORF Transcript_86172/g.239853 Transcript_86172/m.239853 type:complete len:202 (-) Transcript_86172:442-1047(-)
MTVNQSQQHPLPLNAAAQPAPTPPNPPVCSRVVLSSAASAVPTFAATHAWCQPSPPVSAAGAPCTYHATQLARTRRVRLRGARRHRHTVCISAAPRERPLAVPATPADLSFPNTPPPLPSWRGPMTRMRPRRSRAPRTRRATARSRSRAGPRARASTPASRGAGSRTAGIRRLARACMWMRQSSRQSRTRPAPSRRTAMQP